MLAWEQGVSKAFGALLGTPIVAFFADANGFVAARALNPQKARILLQLLLASGETDPAALQQAFDGR